MYIYNTPILLLWDLSTSSVVHLRSRIYVYKYINIYIYIYIYYIYHIYI